jgi:hypothetical protein
MNGAWKIVSSVGGLNPWPLSHESSDLTTRPRLLDLWLWFSRMLCFIIFEKQSNSNNNSKWLAGVPNLLASPSSPTKHLIPFVTHSVKRKHSLLQWWPLKCDHGYCYQSVNVIIWFMWSNYIRFTSPKFFFYTYGNACI